MFKLTIKRIDNSVYWTASFSNLLEANTWLDEEKTRSYWNSSFSYDIQEIIVPSYIPTYRDLRSKEYPDFKDYLDAVVKNDQTQLQNYINQCLAVKLKYPKS